MRLSAGSMSLVDCSSRANSRIESKVSVDDLCCAWSSDSHTRTTGLGSALQARLAPYVISGQDASNEVQPRHIKVLKVPEYFAEYREKGDGLASFLGTSIIAKVRATFFKKTCRCSNFLPSRVRSHLEIQRARIMFRKLTIQVEDLERYWGCLRLFCSCLLLVYLLGIIIIVLSPRTLLLNW